MSDVINDKKALNRLIHNQIRKVLGEAPIAPPPPQAPAPQAPAPTAPAPQQNQTPQPPPGDGVNQVSVNKVAGGDGQDAELQKGQITIEMVVEKLNSIRSGRSFKDEHILDQMRQYFSELNDNERLALFAFLKGIAQIVTADIPAQQAANQQTVAAELADQKPEGSVTKSGMQDVRHVKPNIIHKSTPMAPAPSRENTSAPSPIVPRQR